jgi:hypothetical protein
VFPFGTDASFAGQHFGIGTFHDFNNFTELTCFLIALDKFVKETAISSSDEIELQQKRKTIYQTKYSFPYIENRIEIIDTKVV